MLKHRNLIDELRQEVSDAAWNQVTNAQSNAVVLEVWGPVDEQTSMIWERIFQATEEAIT